MGTVCECCQWKIDPCQDVICDAGGGLRKGVRQALIITFTLVEAAHALEKGISWAQAMSDNTTCYVVQTELLKVRH